MNDEETSSVMNGGCLTCREIIPGRCARPIDRLGVLFVRKVISSGDKRISEDSNTDRQRRILCIGWYRIFDIQYTVHALMAFIGKHFV